MRLSIVTLGHVHTESLVPLTPLFSHIEQLVLDVPPRDTLEQHRPELNRAIDAATADWILIIRERETITEPLAKEIAAAAAASKAWGFRIRSIPHYLGKPLLLERSGGELRLLHRRHLLRRGDVGVQGTVVRLEQTLRSDTFASVEEHRSHLDQKSVRLSAFRRLFRFLGFAIASRTLDRTALQYLWIEAAFDTAS